MSTQTEVQELKNFIGDRFNRFDREFDKLDQKVDKLDREVTKLDQKVDKLDTKIDKTKIELEGKIELVKNDATWIKWLFGFLLSAILVLLSIIVSVLFQLVNKLG